MLYTREITSEEQELLDYVGQTIDTILDNEFTRVRFSYNEVKKNRVYEAYQALENKKIIDDKISEIKLATVVVEPIKEKVK